MKKPSTDKISRRAFLGGGVRFGMTLLAVSASANLIPRLAQSAPRIPQLEETLEELLFQLFPHPGLRQHRDRNNIYRRISNTILEQSDSSTATQEIVVTGINNLNRLAGSKGWNLQTETRRLEILKQIEGTPFFNYLRNTAIDVLYRDPEVWRLVGYGGSAVEHGGYIRRGFDTIDWLPAN